MEYSGPGGYGIGAAHQATPTIRALLKLPDGKSIPVWYESEMGRVMLELGPFGFMFWYLFRILIMAALWRCYVKLRRQALKQLALTAFLVHLISINTQMIFQPTLMVFYWFLAGFIYLLPLLDRPDEWTFPIKESA